MTTALNIIQITPFIHVANLEAALSFFNDILGFKTLFRASNYAYVQRETAGVRILESHAEDGSPHRAHGGFAYYIDVRDVDAIYAELKSKLETLAPEHVTGPVDQEYNQRELMIRAPDGNVFVFGQAIARQPHGPSASRFGERSG
jgi:catechol 2,3-dioxygenase-like lactoylglutathione lyase family enzyme